MKKLLSLILILTLVLSFTACGKSAPDVKPTEAPAAAVAAETAPETTAAAVPETEPAYYPLTVTDQAGRTVTIPAEPQKIISCYYISSSLVIALGQADKMVGIENKPEKRPIYGLAAPELLELANVGSAKELDLEAVAALEPDLVILPLKLKDAAASLEALGICAIYVNPESQELLNEARDLVAQCLNCQEAARALDAFTAELEAELIAGQGSEKPTVYLGGNSAFLSTAGEKMYQSSLISLAGGVNAAAELEDSYWAEISYEQLLAWNPQVILLASDAVYTVEDVLNDENLSGVDAVVNGRVYHMPNDTESWDSPVPGSILGAAWLAAQLHPDTFAPERCEAVIREFYQSFYGFDYDAA